MGKSASLDSLAVGPFWQEDRQGLTTASPRLAATHTGGSGSDDLEYVATEQAEGCTAEAGCW